MVEAAFFPVTLTLVIHDAVGISESPGRGGVNFEEIIRALNQAKYQGPLSIEWEDSGMNREFGAKEACEFTKRL